MKISDEHLPGLYQAADRTSLKAQKIHFLGLVFYLSLLVVASIVSFFDDSSPGNALLSAALFFITLLILILLQVKRPQDIWYNGRAVAESVKTRAWRWMMRAEPYFDCDNKDIVSKQFIEDLREIFNQNRSLANALDADVSTIDPISSCMNELRA
ncbi:MAG: DUF4231 domain-containing protein, partial [bacterium]|nr:DUF4231 domain-containing protein [bacterium]